VKIPTRLLRLLVIFLAFAISAPAADSFARTVHVKSYTKKDGTTVQAHERKAPEARSEKPATTSAAPAHDTHGRILRSEAAKHAFMVQTGYPHGRPGYVVDHVRPLVCGGLDAPINMQWQTIAEAHAKDKTERAGCR
jgi:hypothetical protein